MKRHKQAIKAAFPKTLPILASFSLLGIAYGIYMRTSGFPFWISTLMSVFVFAGSMQFAAVPLLMSAFAPLHVFLLTLMVNARHILYGVSMLGRLDTIGAKKWYVVFALCDETFSLIFASSPPADVDRGLYMTYIALLNHAYWVVGTLIGGLVGAAISFDTTGIDFVMTAFFAVLFIEQWRDRRNHMPAVIGLACSLLMLLALGPEAFLLPAMGLILVVLSVLKKPIERMEVAGLDDA